MKHQKNKILRRKKAKLTRAENAICTAPIQMIVNEYNLIKQKKSRLSAHLRNVVKFRIKFLINKGDIEDPDKPLANVTK